MCPMHSKVKEYQIVGVWNREKFVAGPSKGTGAPAPLNPEFPEGFQQDIFKGQVREGWL